MVGPGLFLAIGLVGASLRAEVPVGVEAKGVDPMAAVDNTWGLDVRDELGRPVSGAKVLTQLKAASTERAVDVARTSNLPKAQVVVAALELLAKATDAVRGLVAGFALAKVWSSLPSPRPKFAAAWLVILAVAPLLAAAFCRPRTLEVALNPCEDRLEVLRC